MLLRLDDVSLAFGSRPLLDHASLQVDEGERVCLVGRNGEGKSSLLRLVSCAVAPDEGSVWVRPGARLAFLAQDLDAVDDARVIDIVAGGLAPDAGESWETGYRVDTVISRLSLDAEARFSSLSTHSVTSSSRSPKASASLAPRGSRSRSRSSRSRSRGRARRPRNRSSACRGGLRPPDRR